ncbi:MAG: hypothetical protein CMP23_06555 [Rickettsiales bacterium]|nr:hypothetical protein [Rickettsiales bacterium]|tara:strand:+ start:3962 stop:4285 length:324 start_codon:yes stop_codon:yes gene_type:complete
MKQLASLLTLIPALMMAASPAVVMAESPADQREVCDDDVDNDGDGLVDCDDIENCSSFHTCGQIQGGWSWVIAVYGLSFAGFAGYALYITRGLNRARKEEADNDQAR